jgi:excisionase family DNA binding protein
MATSQKKNGNGSLTTGEAMNLLPLSRSTISRYLDSGKLEGTKNPITGRRRISKKGLVEFAKRFGLKV